MVEDEDQKIESSEGDCLDSSKCEDGIKTPVDSEIDDHAQEAQNEGENSVDELIAERDQLKDQLLRALAETENMRRRTEREMQSARKYGHTNFARDLVGAIDNLARAIEATGKSDAEESTFDEALQGLIKGIELSWTEIQAVIEKHGIKRIDPEGKNLITICIKRCLSCQQTNMRQAWLLRLFSTAMCSTIDCCGQLWWESRRRLIVQPRK